MTVAEEGMRSLAKGWAPTLIGYSMQGLCKFGFYEVFKIMYSNMLGEVSHTAAMYVMVNCIVHCNVYSVLFWNNIKFIIIDNIMVLFINMIVSCRRTHIYIVQVCILLLVLVPNSLPTLLWLQWKPSKWEYRRNQDGLITSEKVYQN